MTETELYKNLGVLTRDKERWEENIPGVVSMLEHNSVKIKAKALWLLGEMGLAFPEAIGGSVAALASFIGSPEPILRGCFRHVEPYWESLFRLADDTEASVRLAFIWASENIATNTPDPYHDRLPFFAKLLNDSDDRVRMEAPEMFRVLGRRRPEFVKPYVEKLRTLAETDPNRVVRIHCQGAIKATTN